MKYILAITLIILYYSGKEQVPTTEINQLFQNDIKTLSAQVSSLQELIKHEASIDSIRTQFLNTRLAYKRVETLSEYYFPTVSKAINGPAIAEYEENDNMVVDATGLQVIESYLYPDYALDNKTALLEEMGILKSNLIRLTKLAQGNQLSEAHVFDAMRLEVFRIITLGITGYDTPLALNSIPEAISSLEALEQYYKVFAKGKQAAIFNQTLSLFSEGIAFLRFNTDFNTFDRATFILKICNPLSKAICATQRHLGIPFFKEVRGLRTTAETLFDVQAFDANAFAPFADYDMSPEKISLGKQLFNDPILSLNNKRSCASCHHADKAFTDGLEKASTLDGTGLVKRNTPSLVNSVFQRSLFYDSRVVYLEDQAAAVITNAEEMHGSLDAAIIELKQNTLYMTLFSKAYPQKEINAFTIKNALASYIRSLTSVNTKFDKYFRGESTFSATEIQGFNLYAGKAKCATCHFIPLTNGTVPPNFSKTESEVIGIPNKQGQLDNDLGKYNISKVDIHRFAFKTQSLRNIEQTAPYMHNGVYNTLEEVIDFYNKGGGIGLGFDVPNQSLSADSLGLSKVEQQALISFLKTLND